MDQQRGRSPSNGHQQPHISHSNSASPHQFQDNGNAGLGLGLEDSLDQQYTSTSYTQNLAAYSNNFLGNQQGQVYVQGGLIDPVFTQSANFNQQGDFTQQFKQEELSPHNNASNSPYYQQQQSFSQQLLGDGGFDQEDFPLYSPPSGQDQFDPAAYMNHPQQAMAQSINPANLNMADMTTPPTHSPTPPHAQQNQLKPELSPHHSPAFNQHQFGRSPGHSRHTSLGPESAAFPQGGLMDPQWAMMNPAFSGHRRTPSEYSDRSVSSVAPSPNLPQHDNFDHSHSPLVRPTDQGHYPQELLPMEQFSLGGNQVHHGLPSPRRGLSPAHSPAISPRLGPQQMPMMDNTSNFMIGAGISNLGYLPSNAPPMYGGDGQDSFDNQNRHGSTEMGQAAQMVAPEINVEFAPPSRQSSFEPPKPMTLDQDALTPPHRGMLPLTPMWFYTQANTDQVEPGPERSPIHISPCPRRSRPDLQCQVQGSRLSRLWKLAPAQERDRSRRWIVPPRVLLFTNGGGPLPIYHVIQYFVLQATPNTNLARVVASRTVDPDVSKSTRPPSNVLFAPSASLEPTI
jgi:hypothetical protein